MPAIKKVVEIQNRARVRAAEICDLTIAFNMPGEAAGLIRAGASLEQARAYLQAKLDAYPIVRACAKVAAASAPENLKTGKREG